MKQLIISWQEDQAKRQTFGSVFAASQFNEERAAK